MNGAMTGISIFGASGRMGQAIAEAAELRGDVRIAEHHPDVFVDFSVPAAVEGHLASARRAGKPILIGTTGLDPGHHRLIDEAAAEIPLIYAANTSLGVNLLAHLVRETAARLGDDWDLEIVEMHHRMKADSPSGTALMLGRAAAEGRGVALDRGGGAGPRRDHRAARAGADRLRRAARRVGRGRASRHLRGGGRAARARPPGGEPGDLRPGRDRGGSVAGRQAGGPLLDGGRAGAEVTRAEIAELYRRLHDRTPSPETELEYVNNYTLLVAVVLSAQATDASVNLATRALFETVDSPAAMVALGEEGLKRHIKTIGLFNTKAKNVIALSQALIERHGGEVPTDLEALQALPGVGRKTANVVMNCAFGAETFAVDTHVFRVSNRTGLAPGKDVLEVERKLDKATPPPVPPRRPSPAHPPRPLRLQGEEAGMLAVRRRRYLPLPAQDPAAGRRAAAPPLPIKAGEAPRPLLSAALPRTRSSAG